VTAAQASAVERHPHLGTPLPSGWVRVDLHSHTMFSGDSTTTLDEVEAAIGETGIDVLCVTDHNAVRGAEQLAERGACRIVVGEELRTHAGEIIGLFLTERIPFGTSPPDAARAIREQGGVVYVPHPFDPLRNNMAAPALDELVAAGMVDALEVFNAKTSLQSLNRRAAEYAATHGLAPGAGSDAHVPLGLGAAFVEMPDFDSPAGFLDSLRAGRVVGHHWDRARPWSSRIVPSLEHGGSRRVSRRFPSLDAPGSANGGIRAEIARG
jgi:predicted metal-dependent phosphoesterase TrpH